MHTKVLRGLRIRDTPILDQPHSLKLELPCKLPSLHDTPPVPSKHLTQCLRNRVQAKRRNFRLSQSSHDTLKGGSVSVRDDQRRMYFVGTLASDIYRLICLELS